MTHTGSRWQRLRWRISRGHRRWCGPHSHGVTGVYPYVICPHGFQWRAFVDPTDPDGGCWWFPWN